MAHTVPSEVAADDRIFELEAAIIGLTQQRDALLAELVRLGHAVVQFADEACESVSLSIELGAAA